MISACAEFISWAWAKESTLVLQEINKTKFLELLMGDDLKGAAPQNSFHLCMSNKLSLVSLHPPAGKGLPPKSK